MPSEADFRKWYAGHAAKLGLDPNPDDVRHYYDWRAAYRAGAKPDTQGHWPSQFKRTGHPRLVIGGIDTRTGQLAGRSNMPLSKYLGRHTARILGKAVKAPPLTAVQKRAAKVAKLEAGRRATAKRLAGQKATTRAELRARQTGEPVKPLTPAERAARLREKLPLTPPGIKRLTEALEPKKKKD